MAAICMDTKRCVVLTREGKGGRDRMIPLGSQALYWVQQYMEHGREALAWHDKDKTLFLGNEGKPLSPLWVSTVIARRVDATKLGKRGGGHLFMASTRGERRCSGPAESFGR